MSIKLGGYGSNRENAVVKIFTKVMLIVAESQFPWPENSISVPFDTRVRGGCKIGSF